MIADNCSEHDQLFFEKSFLFWWMSLCLKKWSLKENMENNPTQRGFLVSDFQLKAVFVYKTDTTNKKGLSFPSSSVYMYFPVLLLLSVCIHRKLLPSKSGCTRFFHLTLDLSFWQLAADDYDDPSTPAITREVGVHKLGQNIFTIIAITIILGGLQCNKCRCDMSKNNSLTNTWYIFFDHNLIFSVFSEKSFLS